MQQQKARNGTRNPNRWRGGEKYLPESVLMCSGVDVTPNTALSLHLSPAFLIHSANKHVDEEN
jgi:hypothetical protein